MKGDRKSIECEDKEHFFLPHHIILELSTTSVSRTGDPLTWSKDRLHKKLTKLV